MLTVRPIAGGRAGYYLSDLASELPAPGTDGTDASREPAAVGRWAGRGAAGLGLEGPVDGDRFASMLEGEVVGPADPRTTRTAYDVVVAAPKSVSLLMALGDPATASAVLVAHRDAVGQALAYLEHSALAVRRRAGDERTLLPVNGAVAATFTHGTSRDLDPHLHTHVVVVNRAQGADGRWTALDGRGLFAHSRAAGALYESALRHRLGADLGVGWVRRRRGTLEVDGVDPTWLGTFSRRSAAIRTHLWERGLASPRAVRVAWAATRDPKAAEEVRATLGLAWRQRAAAMGFEPPDLGRVRGRPAAGPAALDEHRFAGALAAVPTVGRRHVVAAWADAVTPGAPAAAVEAAVDHWVTGPRRVGVAEEPLARRSLVPAPHLLDTLGPRPATGDGQPAWRHGAHLLDAYRTRWPAGPEPLHPDAGGRGAVPVAQLADLLATERGVEDVRRRLGRAVDRLPPTIEREMGGLVR